ncbi:hypothetical protein ACIBBE_45585 [Streptomyces sp. NPDC051644]|uniref:hypothetical protein n=1 Tax=Streptomyces sp. NPDC051644 TaxID=3365666 RepID=UPI0037A6ADF1
MTLAQQLGLPTNTADCRAAWQDKALMYRTVGRAGLDVPQDTMADSPAARGQMVHRLGPVRGGGQAKKRARRMVHWENLNGKSPAN